MSMMRCDGCGNMVDTDYKPFYYDVEVGYIELNLCEKCFMLIEDVVDDKCD